MLMFPVEPEVSTRVPVAWVIPLAVTEPSWQTLLVKVAVSAPVGMSQSPVSDTVPPLGHGYGPKAKGVASAPRAKTRKRTIRKRFLNMIILLKRRDKRTSLTSIWTSPPEESRFLPPFRKGLVLLRFPPFPSFLLARVLRFVKSLCESCQLCELCHCTR